MNKSSSGFLSGWISILFRWDIAQRHHYSSSSNCRFPAVAQAGMRKGLEGRKGNVSIIGLVEKIAVQSVLPSRAETDMLSRATSLYHM